MEMFAEEADVWVGRQYGPYSIKELLGRGTVAHVYRAALRDGNEVALKVLTPFAEARQEIRSLFEQEFELMVRVEHPNVLKAMQAGVIAGTHYMEIEPINGETLWDRVQSSKASSSSRVHRDRSTNVFCLGSRSSPTNRSSGRQTVQYLVGRRG
ncbi:MAG: protein kinase domain-containing protein [Candidatus Poriferisodalaceae bacterium]